MSTFKIRYDEHKQSSRVRGIQFLLTFEEWCRIWIDSGHWEERGCHRGEYCMARFGDKGPYAVGNVKIILHTQNLSESSFEGRSEKARGRKHSLETREKIRQGRIGWKHTPESLEKMRIAKLGNKNSLGHQNSLGYKHTPEACAKIAAANTARALKRREENQRLHAN